MEACEAKLNSSNGKISFNGWFRASLVLVTVILTLAGGITSYAYMVVIPSMDQKISRNVEQITQLRVSLAKLSNIETKVDALIEDINEFKQLLRRQVPPPKTNFNN